MRWPLISANGIGRRLFGSQNLGHGAAGADPRGDRGHGGDGHQRAGDHGEQPEERRSGLAQVPAGDLVQEQSGWDPDAGRDQAWEQLGSG